MPCEHGETCTNCYEQGKYDAYFDFINAMRVGHPADCGCDPCYSARAFIYIHSWQRCAPVEKADNPWVNSILKSTDHFVHHMIQVTVRRLIADALAASPEAALLVNEDQIVEKCERIAQRLTSPPNDVSRQWVGHLVRMMDSAVDAGDEWVDELVRGV